MLILDWTKCGMLYVSCYLILYNLSSLSLSLALSLYHSLSISLSLSPNVQLFPLLQRIYGRFRPCFYIIICYYCDKVKIFVPLCTVHAVQCMKVARKLWCEISYHKTAQFLQVSKLIAPKLNISLYYT